MVSPFCSVITTIQEPTASVRALAHRLGECQGSLVIVGDSKGPSRFPLPGVDGFRAADQLSFLSLEDQLGGPFELARLLPVKHYARKNIGYLHAIARGARCIYETDDDNAPLLSWGIRPEYVNGARVISLADGGAGKARSVNVYRLFTDALIWPRGLPLDQIHTGSCGTQSSPDGFVSPGNASGEHWAPIQQGLANGSPDVDAVWRLVLDRDFQFENNPSVILSPGSWCPFNTQSTWWWPVVYPLLYVPSNCPFRMCDIWKSFVAQRCLWELGAGVAFHAPEVVQDRNDHNLMADFEDEIPGYRRNGEMIAILEDLSLVQGVNHRIENLRTCYEALVAAKFFPAAELDLLDAWIADLQPLMQANEDA